ncbi:hypothetical protein [Pseudolysobacter antarcticus]|uniref:hypothetical protein n=1 Tax=Pseudolysobacter antarcticus TaxID=2511995 RepID=UPI0013EAE76F|nr:hypothetical protein [Pseudolysobacter antarcticus]
MARHAESGTRRLGLLVFGLAAGAGSLAANSAPPPSADVNKAPASSVSAPPGAATATAAPKPGSTAMPPSAALLEYLGEFSDNNGDWTDPASLDDSGLLDRPESKRQKGRSDDGTAQN